MRAKRRHRAIEKARRSIIKNVGNRITDIMVEAGLKYSLSEKDRKSYEWRHKHDRKTKI